MLLRNKDKERLIALFETAPIHIEVWAYGSRVNRNAHEGSDLDLVIRTTDLKKMTLDIFIRSKKKLKKAIFPSS